MKVETKRIIKNTALYKWYIERRGAIHEHRSNQRRALFVERILPRNGVGAELGVFKGDFSSTLMSRTTAREFHMIDPWYFSTPYWHWGYGDRSTIRALIRILKRFEKDIENGRVRVHVGDDRQILTTFPDQYFDWVYIDSSHFYEHTRDELQILARKVKHDGVIAGDDWQPDPTHRHHGVCKAVSEFVGSTKHKLVYADAADRQWAIAMNR